MTIMTMTSEQLAALLTYAERANDIALIHGARLAAKGDPAAVEWCACQVDTMALTGEVWR